MICLFSFSILFLLLTAASAVPLRYLLLVAGLTEDDFCDRRGAVKLSMVFERWLIAVEPWLNDGSNASKRDRSVSITYEILGTGGDFSGERFQNKGTFIVVRSSVFGKSSVQKTHLARDAYNA